MTRIGRETVCGTASSWSTSEGIILADPINTDFAKWLKSELDSRFPGIPVRYVIYSHSHWDHIEGGAVFADTAQFVGQEEFSAIWTAGIHTCRAT